MMLYRSLLENLRAESEDEKATYDNEGDEDDKEHLDRMQILLIQGRLVGS